LMAPVRFNDGEIRNLIHIMKNDKKNFDDNIVFVLPVLRGKVELCKNVDERLIVESLEGEWI